MRTATLVLALTSLWSLSNASPASEPLSVGLPDLPTRIPAGGASLRTSDVTVPTSTTAPTSAANSTSTTSSSESVTAASSTSSSSVDTTSTTISSSSSVNTTSTTISSSTSAASPTSTFIISEEERRAAFPFDPGFDIEAAAALAESLPTHSWEYGSAAEALLELYNPDIAVFGSKPFPVPALEKSKVKSLTYADDRITIGAPPNIFADGAGSAGDPFSLGVAGVMLGKTQLRYVLAVEVEINYLLNDVPRWYNGAMSHRADVAELWSDWMYMVPPALAYYAVDANDRATLQEAVNQCGYYRQALQANLSDYAPYKGVWEHIVGPQSPEHGLWSTGNAWAVGGMSRVLATVMKAPKHLTHGWRDEAIHNLSTWIKEIIDGALAAPPDDGLLRNYLNDTETDHGFGEISGSSLIAAVSYRMAVLLPHMFGQEYIDWADNLRRTLGGTDRNGNPHVKPDGVVTPAVNPLGWLDTAPWTTGSPEGNNFVVLMYVAWRDCVKARVCSQYGGPRKRSLLSYLF
ncbi:hypothetical protein V5O48_010935 [Marasmius crinis-equi]|uniref:Glycosyl hydrolase family 88 n=1 Tax=Marasmius crinis-equi TaxID=585013 RepID=A0ABR3F6Z4_9AGAR